MLIFNSLTYASQDTTDSDVLDETTFTDYFDDCLSYIDDENYLQVKSITPCS